MRYSDDVIEEVRSSNDIVDIIGGYVKLKRHGSSYFGLCPFHNEKTPSFSVSPDKQMYYCFGCGAGGNVYTFLMQYDNLTFPEAVKTLAERAGIELPELEYSEEARKEADRKSLLLEINREAARYFYAKLRQPSGETAMAYLRGRELSEETMRSFGLGYADRYSNDLYRYMKQKGYRDEVLKDSGLFLMDERRGASDKFWNRVMFPIMDVNNRVIGFGGRVMGDGKPKYLNSPETPIFDKSRNLYGLNAAKRSRQKAMILCEGYMDVISMHQAGFTNAVASLGTSLTSGHCSLLKRYTDQVLLLYDSDDAGVRAALRAIPMLRETGLTSRVVNLRPHKDPDEFIKAEGAEAFQERLDGAENSFLFEVRMMERDFDLRDPEGKSRFLHRAARHLLDLEDELERDSHLDALAQKYHVSPDVLHKMVGKLALQGAGRREVEEPKKLRAEHGRVRENGSEKAQKLLITWMANNPDIIGTVRQYVSPDDFTDPLYQTVVRMLLEQYERGAISPAEILNHFEESGEQTRAAALFNTEITLDTEKDRKKALQDVIWQIRKKSLDRKLAELSPTDLEGLQKLAEEKRKLDELRLHGIV